MVCWATAQTIFGNSIHAVEIYVSFKDAGDAFFGERIYASQKDSREFESIKAVLYNNYYTNLAGFVSTATVHSAAYQRDGVYDALNTLRPVDGYILNSRRIQPGHGTHDLVMELTTWSWSTRFSSYTRRLTILPLYSCQRPVDFHPILGVWPSSPWENTAWSWNTRPGHGAHDLVML